MFLRLCSPSIHTGVDSFRKLALYPEVKDKPDLVYLCTNFTGDIVTGLQTASAATFKNIRAVPKKDLENVFKTK